MTQPCSTPDCNNPAEQTICGRCVTDLAAWIAQIPELMVELFTTMARLDNVATGRNGGSPTKTDHPMPIRADAADMRAALRIWNRQNARALANDPHAGGFVPMIADLVTRARDLIDLPPDETIRVAKCRCGAILEARPDYTVVDCVACHLTYTRHAIEEWNEGRIDAASEPLDADATVAWVNDRARKHIKTKDLINWVARKKIRFVLDRVPNDTEKAERYYVPAEVLRLRHQHVKA